MMISAVSDGKAELHERYLRRWNTRVPVHVLPLCVHRKSMKATVTRLGT
jgi:hypothetical protein